MRTSWWACVALCWSTVTQLAAWGSDGNVDSGSTLAVVERDGLTRVEIRVQDETLLRSPDEGLWSIAMTWKDDWPTQWQHAHPQTVAHVGPWTVLTGQLQTPAGAWGLRDAYRVEGSALRCVRRWTWTGPKPLEHCTLCVRWLATGPGAQALLPGILYYGNPSGKHSGRVPVFGGQDGEEALYEEHRFPLPFASLEWERAGRRQGAALHTLPSRAPYGNLGDQWWSLGVIAHRQTTELALLSGPCASNGQRSVIKAVQRGFKPYPDAYLNMPSGAVIEKTFFLEAYPVARKGSGFVRPLQTSFALHQPYSLEGLPTFEEIVRAKYRFAQSRWHCRAKSAGFRKYPDRNVYVMGWCGQAAAPGYALLALAERLNDPQAVTMAQRSLDHLATAPFNEQGFLVQYEPDRDHWHQQHWVSQGQAMENFARAILAGRRVGGVDTSKWEAFLHRACDVHAARILAKDWHPRSTNEGFLVSPLCQAHRLFGKDVHRRAALKAARHYAQRHLDMTEPYWGGTLDAECEDKEGAWAAFQAFLAIYEMTKDEEYLGWAEHAMDVALTYTVAWDIGMPPGRMRDHAFKSRGWTVVSPQNQHLDVFGVLYTPEIYRMGQYLKRKELKRLSLVMYRSCGQLIDPYGSQGEQIQQTNYAQRGDVTNIDALRGGYSEGWTVFWITAHFLNAAAKFEEMGVPVWSD